MINIFVLFDWKILLLRVLKCGGMSGGKTGEKNPPAAGQNWPPLRTSLIRHPTLELQAPASWEIRDSKMSGSGLEIYYLIALKNILKAPQVWAQLLASKWRVSERLRDHPLYVCACLEFSFRCVRLARHRPIGCLVASFVTFALTRLRLCVLASVFKFGLVYIIDF